MGQKNCFHKKTQTASKGVLRILLWDTKIRYLPGSILSGVDFTIFNMSFDHKCMPEYFRVFFSCKLWFLLVVVKLHHSADKLLESLEYFLKATCRTISAILKVGQTQIGARYSFCIEIPCQ